MRDTVSGFQQQIEGNGTGSFILSARPVAGTVYGLQVLQQPAGQACNISNASGTVTANVSNITLSCALTAPSAPTNLTVSYSVKNYAFSWSAAASATFYELLEDPDGIGVQPEVQLGSSIDATTATLSLASQLLHRRLNASYRVRACNAAGCSSPTAALAPNLTQAIGYVKSSNTGINENISSVAMSADGNTLAMGAYGEDSNATGIGGNQADNSAPDSGAVYVFTRSGGVWSQQAYVKASNTDPGDSFGISVALSADGNTLAVGAIGEDNIARGIGNQADNSFQNAGAVYVFTRSSGTWSQQAYVKASDVRPIDLFGTSVSLSADGNTLAVGAPGEDSGSTGINGEQFNNDAGDSGAVYVFIRSASTWSQQAYVKASNTELGDRFGGRLSLSSDGNTLAVAASGESSNATGIGGNQANNSAFLSGAVYVFTRNASNWSQQAYVKASNTQQNDSFGSSLALSGDGNTLAVGADWEGSNATGINGNQISRLAVASGAVYVYIRSAGTWSQQAYLKASNTGAADRFGGHVALSTDGNTLAVGATGESSDATGFAGSQTNNSASGSGATYVFTRSASTWSQQAYVKASNTQEGDFFGGNVALSADGNTLAVTASGEDSSATGIGGNQADNASPNAGAIYIY